MAFDPAIEIDITGFIEFGSPCVSSGGGEVFSSGLDIDHTGIEFGSPCVSSGGGEVFSSAIDIDFPDVDLSVPYVAIPENFTYTPAVEGLTPYAILHDGGDGVNIFPSVEIVWDFPPPIVAAFSADPERGLWPLTVVFTDESTGDVIRWEWDFDDPYDPSSTTQHPTHMFRRAGTYLVTLRVYDQYGRMSEATGVIIVTYRIAGNFALEKQQGVGFSFDTGDSLVYPYDNFPPVLIYDSNDQPTMICFDRTDGKPYNISTRDGPPDLSMVKYWKDKVAAAGTGGTEIAPRFGTFEARGNYEHYFLESKRFHLYVRNVDDDDRGAAGFDTNGYPDGLLVQLDLYGDGNPTTGIAKAERISLPKHQITFDERISDVNRLWGLFTFNRAKMRVTGWDGDVVAKDQPCNTSGLVQTEGGYEQEVAEPALWIGLHWGVLKNFITGAEIAGTVVATTGPDSQTDAVSFAAALTFPSVTLAGGSLFLWTQGTVALTIGGEAVTLTEYATVGSWSLKYATGITKTGAVVLTPTGTGKLFDLRVLSGAITTNYLAYYKADVENNSGNKVLKR